MWCYVVWLNSVWWAGYGMGSNDGECDVVCGMRRSGVVRRAMNMWA